MVEWYESLNVFQQVILALVSGSFLYFYVFKPLLSIGHLSDDFEKLTEELSNITKELKEIKEKIKEKENNHA